MANRKEGTRVPKNGVPTGRQTSTADRAVDEGFCRPVGTLLKTRSPTGGSRLRLPSLCPFGTGKGKEAVYPNCPVLRNSWRTGAVTFLPVIEVNVTSPGANFAVRTHLKPLGTFTTPWM